MFLFSYYCIHVINSGILFQHGYHIGKERGYYKIKIGYGMKRGCQPYAWIIVILSEGGGGR